MSDFIEQLKKNIEIKIKTDNDNKLKLKERLMSGVLELEKEILESAKTDRYFSKDVTGGPIADWQQIVNFFQEKYPQLKAKFDHRCYVNNKGGTSSSSTITVEWNKEDL